MFDQGSNMSDDRLDTYSIEQMKLISDRMYCLWQALTADEANTCCFSNRYATVAHDAWSALEDLIDDEEIKNNHVLEEMKKFTEGFAYGRAKRSPTC